MPQCCLRVQLLVLVCAYIALDAAAAVAPDDEPLQLPQPLSVLAGTGSFNTTPPTGWCKGHVYNPDTARVASQWLQASDSSLQPDAEGAWGLVAAMRTAWAHHCLANTVRRATSNHLWRRWLELCDVHSAFRGDVAVSATRSCFRGASAVLATRRLAKGSSSTSGEGLHSVDVGRMWDYVGPFSIGKGACSGERHVAWRG